MYKKTIELLANFLQIENKKDRRKYNKGNIIPINLNIRQDQAYIKVQFKKFLMTCKNSNMVITSNRLQGYRVNLDEYNFNNLDDRNKLISIIDFTTKEILSNNEVPIYLKFEF